MASKTPGPVTPRSGVPVTSRSGVPVTTAPVAPQRPPSAKKKRMAEDKAENYYRVGLVGSGNMARAIVEGLLASGQFRPSSITASATSETSENLRKMKSFGVNVTCSNRDVILNSDIILITVKPHQVMDVMTEIQTVHTEGHSVAHATPKNLRPLIVSVAAGITIDDMEQKTEISWNMGGSSIAGHLPLIRCLPNLGCCVRAGMIAYTRGKFCNETDTTPFLTVFSLVGHCEEVLEKYIDTFAAYGSAVAFMSIAVEALADGGVLAGLPRPMAQRISAHTMISAAKIILEGKKHPAEVKDAVASPSGTTIHGIRVLEKAGFRSALMDALKTAKDRAEQLRQ